MCTCMYITYTCVYTSSYLFTYSAVTAAGRATLTGLQAPCRKDFAASCVGDAEVSQTHLDFYEFIREPQKPSSTIFCMCKFSSHCLGEAMLTMGVKILLPGDCRTWDGPGLPRPTRAARPISANQASWLQSRRRSALRR